MTNPTFILADPQPFEEEPQPWDDTPWEVFIPDEDQLDPLPEVGDFWTDNDEAELRLINYPRSRRESQPCCH